MTAFSHLPLQKAIYQVFTNDLTLMNMIQGVYDKPPEGNEFPYVTLGESICSDHSTKTTTGMEQILSVHIWSRDESQQPGRSERAGRIVD